MKRYVAYDVDALGNITIDEFDNAISAKIHAELTQMTYFEYQDKTINLKQNAIETAVNRYMAKKDKHIKVGPIEKRR